MGIARSLSPPVAPITNKRYVDDTHDRFNSKKESESFLKILNDQEPRIKFEPECENSDKELSFLDSTIKATIVLGYFEKTLSQIYRSSPIHAMMKKTKIGVFKGYVRRA